MFRVCIIHSSIYEFKNPGTNLLTSQVRLGDPYPSGSTQVEVTGKVLLFIVIPGRNRGALPWDPFLDTRPNLIESSRGTAVRGRSTACISLIRPYRT